MLGLARFFFVNLTQFGVIWEEVTLNRRMPVSDWPEDKLVGHIPDQ